MARRRRTGTTWQPSDCLAAERSISAVNLGTVSDIKDAIFIELYYSIKLLIAN